MFISYTNNVNNGCHTERLKASKEENARLIHVDCANSICGSNMKKKLLDIIKDFHTQTGPHPTWEDANV